MAEYEGGLLSWMLEGFYTVVLVLEPKHEQERSLGREDPRPHAGAALGGCILNRVRPKRF